MQLGIEVLLQSPELIAELKGKNIGLVAHPASVTKHLQHSLDLLHHHSDLQLTAGFGPQHGIMGDKQPYHALQHGRNSAY